MIPAESSAYFRDVTLLHLNGLNACNLRCAYCAVSADGDVAALPRMTPEQCIEIIDFALASTARGRLKVEIMGGEPLLLGKTWFQQVLGSLKGKPVNVAFTSNATLLDDEWAQLLGHHKVNVCVSLDGPVEVHNGQRGGYNRVIAGLKTLLHHGIRPHVIAVATAAVLDHIDDLLTLYSSLGIRSFFLNDVRDLGRAVSIADALTPTADGMLKAAVTVLEHMRQNRLALVENQLMERVFRYFHDYYFDNVCNHPTCPAGSAFVSVNAAGDVFPCACETAAEHRLGNLYAGCDPLRREVLLRAYHAMPPFYLACLTCQASDICFFGCTASRKRDMHQTQRDCQYTQLLYEFFRQNEKLISDLHEMGMEVKTASQRNRDAQPAPCESASGGRELR